MTSILTKKGNFVTEMHRKRVFCGDKDKDLQTKGCQRRPPETGREAMEPSLLFLCQEGSTWPTPWSQTSSFQNTETVNVWCLGHLVYGTSFWQPRETNIGPMEPGCVLFLFRVDHIIRADSSDTCSRSNGEMTPWICFKEGKEDEKEKLFRL